MVWESKYETGNEQIDSEHKELFRLVENVVAKSYTDPGQIKSAVDFLTNYATTHFRNEEMLMEESAYPIAHIHRKQHSDFVVAVVALVKRVLNESDGAKNRADIEEVVINWLVDHVLGSDKIMADHYRKWALSS